MVPNGKIITPNFKYSIVVPRFVVFPIVFIVVLMEINTTGNQVSLQMVKSFKAGTENAHR
jgi:hypothetical protein